jgi:UDP-N-acetylglucosamine--N-acetylmuramyl-(pentapeptide) pyrophosphoryl-undecaprenol N-acetylglucosamine transferase
MFFTGGYVAVPMALAGRDVPSLLYVPDIEPGLALKTLARFADKIALTTDASLPYFKRLERLVVTGYPTRLGLNQRDRAEAKKVLNLTDEAPVLLAWGGSKGARSINNAIIAALPALLERAQVVHLTGELDWEKIQEQTKTAGPRYHAYPYLHEEMGAALASADLVISRAGASALGEYPLFGLPAILVPYPFAWRYQKVNADYLAGRGAAVVVEDQQLAERLIPVVVDLLDHPEKRTAMKAAMQRLARPDAAAEIGRHLISLSGRGEKTWSA